MTAVPVSASARTRSKSRSTESGPRGAVGSSRISMRGRTAKAFASSRRCFWATERWSTRSSRCTRRSMSSSTARMPSTSERPPDVSTSAGRARRRFSATVRSGSTAGCWWTMAIPHRVAAAGVSESVLLTVDGEDATVGLDGPGGDPHQRRLAGTVLPEERVHLARQHLEGDVGERRDAGIALRDARQQHRRLSHGHSSRLGHVVVLHGVGVPPVWVAGPAGWQGTRPAAAVT